MENPQELAKMLLDAIMNQHFGLAAALVIMLVVLLVKKGAVPVLVSKFPKLSFLDNKSFGVAIAIAGPVAAAIITALLAAQPITIGLIVTALLTSLGGIGAWSAQKNVREGLAAKSDEKAVASIVGLK